MADMSRASKLMRAMTESYTGTIRAAMGGSIEPMTDPGQKWGPYKHFRRPSRCTCPDCNRDYGLHNREVRCECQQCIEWREAGMPAPATTSYEAQQDMYHAHAQAQRDRHRAGQYTYSTVGEQLQANEAVKAERKLGKGKTVGNLNICERPKCNAIIKGDAAGYVDYCTDLTKDRVHRVLCPACIGDLMAVLDSEPLTDRERAYDKPWEPPSDEDSVEAATAEQLAAALFQKLMKQQRAIEGAEVADTD